MSHAFIYDAVRTARGKGKKGGKAHEVKPTDLLKPLYQALEQRNKLDTQKVADVLLGCVTQVQEQGANIARVSALAAGWNQDVPGMTINRFCASGLEACNSAAMKVMSGQDSLVVGGGVESMSRCAMGADGGAWYLDPILNNDLGFIPQGVSADLVATLEGFTREDVDNFAVQSHKKAVMAWEEKRFQKSIVPLKSMMGEVLLAQDELIRPDASLEGLKGLNPSFQKPGDYGFDTTARRKYPMVERVQHVHHAGNSSGIVDGAALMLIGNEKIGKELNLTPRARFVATAVIGSEPTIMLTGPTPSAQLACKKAGLKISDIDLFEVNEAFAAVVLKFIKDLDIDKNKVNVNGGAIAMGHPLGATGAVILNTLVDELERTKKRYGLATLCVGAGMGIATIIERL